MLAQTRRSIALQFRGYYGLKRFLIFVTVLWSAAIAVLIYWKHRFIDITALYVVFYWSSQGRKIAELVLLAILMYFVLRTDFLKREFTRFFGYCEHLEPDIYRQPPGWRESLLAFLCLSVCIPFADLYSSGVEQYFLKYSSPLLMVLRLLLNTTGKHKYTGRINRLKFDSRYFNPAGLGAKSSELEASVGKIKYLQRQFGETILHPIEESEWKGVEHMIVSLSKYIGCTHPEWLTLHEQTTEAVEFAIEEIYGSWKSQGRDVCILHTDAEYPGLIDHTIRKLEAQGRIRSACVSILPEVLQGGDPNEIADRIVARAIESKANVLLISHVIFSVGYVIDVDGILGKLDRAGARLIAIVDGAQAAGNLAQLDPELNSVEYYASCTQKWLCTSHNLGFLVRNHARLKGKGVECRPTTRAFSSLNGNDQMGPTIALHPYYELAVLLEREFYDIHRREEITKHNAELANVFETEIRQFGYESIGRRVPNGIVAIKRNKEQAEALETRLVQAGMQCARIPLPGNGDLWVLRFSIHYFHESFDVFELIKILGNEWRTQETARGRRGFVSTVAKDGGAVSLAARSN